MSVFAITGLAKAGSSLAAILAFAVAHRLARCDTCRHKQEIDRHAGTTNYLGS